MVSPLWYTVVDGTVAVPTAIPFLVINSHAATGIGVVLIGARLALRLAPRLYTFLD